MTRSDDIRHIPQDPSQKGAADDGALQDVVRQAFDAFHAPQEARAAALEAIERHRVKGVQKTEDVAMVHRAPMPRQRRFRVIGTALAAAACVVAVVVGVLGLGMWNSPAAYVGIDVNPSLELSVNRFGTVVGAQALNEDAQAVLDAVDISNVSYQDALSRLLGSEAMAQYLEEGSFVEVNVTTDDENLAASLESASNTCLRDAGCEGACHRADGSLREQAHHAGMGVGKYAAAQRLAELDPQTSIEDCAEMSMSELRDRIRDCEDDGAEHQKHADGDFAGNEGYHAYASSDSGRQSQGGHNGEYGRGRSDE